MPAGTRGQLARDWPRRDTARAPGRRTRTSPWHRSSSGGGAACRCKNPGPSAAAAAGRPRRPRPHRRSLPRTTRPAIRPVPFAGGSAAFGRPARPRDWTGRRSLPVRPGGRGAGMDHRQAEHQGGGARREQPSRAAIQRPVAPRLVEQRPQPMLQDVRPRHGDVHREPRRPHRSGQLEQLARVIGGTFSGEDDAVVTGVLALEPQPMERVPGQGVEPVQSGREAAGQLEARVEPPDVGQLVQQHQPTRCWSGQLGASSGSRMTGRTTPQVSGIGVAPLWSSSTTGGSRTSAGATRAAPASPRRRPVATAAGAIGWPGGRAASATRPRQPRLPRPRAIRRESPTPRADCERAGRLASIASAPNDRRSRV